MKVENGHDKIMTCITSATIMTTLAGYSQTSNSLEDIRRVLLNPEPEDIIEISPEVREGSLRCIDNMFRYVESGK